ncbi:hypothetical protein AAF712_005164 [Marasmius tenuissimus]|uniref:Uncharacterized protein n=1 Tax=Marasmius tenuissimus TaxID=585030 RepID=A0ABR3A346_9AGAR
MKRNQPCDADDDLSLKRPRLVCSDTLPTDSEIAPRRRKSDFTRFFKPGGPLDDGTDSQQYIEQYYQDIGEDMFVANNSTGCLPSNHPEKLGKNCAETMEIVVKVEESDGSLTMPLKNECNGQPLQLIDDETKRSLALEGNISRLQDQVSDLLLKNQTAQRAALESSAKSNHRYSKLLAKYTEEKKGREEAQAETKVYAGLRRKAEEKVAGLEAQLSGMAADKDGVVSELSRLKARLRRWSES